MFGVAGFNNAMDSDGGYVGAGERQVVVNIHDAGAFLGDQGDEARKAARPIADRRGETAEAAVVGQAAFENAAKDVGIDISPTERQNHFPALQLRHEASEASRKRSRSSAFH